MTMSGVDGKACWTSLTNETDGVRPPPRPSEPQISSRSAPFCTALRREISSRVCQLEQRPREMVVGDGWTHTLADSSESTQTSRSRRRLAESGILRFP